MANDITNIKALLECSSRIRDELADVKRTLSSAMSQAEEVLQQANPADGSESLEALRALVAEAARVDELSNTCRDALGAIAAIVNPLEQLLAVLGSEVEYWKRRALGADAAGDKLEPANEAPANSCPSTGIGSLLHEAIADRLDPALVAELETDTIARMAEEELGAEVRATVED